MNWLQQIDPYLSLPTRTETGLNSMTRFFFAQRRSIAKLKNYLSILIVEPLKVS